MIRDVVRLLSCPVCAADVAETPEGDALTCTNAHSFDIAKQGYVSLMTGEGSKSPGDSPAMVEARAEFIGAGHFAPIVAALENEARSTSVSGCVIDVGSGPGQYLAAVLDAFTGRYGVALDNSKAALKRAARAHPRAVAVGADTWQGLPLKDDVAALAICAFAPRNADEFARVLAPGGHLVVVTPAPYHLSELVRALGLLTVPTDKDDRLDAQLAPHLRLIGRKDVTFSLSLTRAEAGKLVAMGPSAWHVDLKAVGERLAALPEPIRVQVWVKVSRYRSAI